jgi:NAD kinase
MSSKAPRVVVVARPTEYEQLLVRHGTRAQAAFFLKTRGQDLAALDARHQKQAEALHEVLSAIPTRWRRSLLERRNLARFVFEPEDVLVAVGQDGLIANMAKYLSGQRVIGINPDPSSYDGVLARHRASAARELLVSTQAGTLELELRTMVQVSLDDGQRLLALNEIFLGHRAHQSARYRIRAHGVEERQASSGTIVATGTGATGWARSIQRERREPLPLPGACTPELVFLVREAFPSVSTGTSLTQGHLGEDEALELVSEMNEAGVVFADGIEDDRIEFPWGMRARISLANERLALVV